MNNLEQQYFVDLMYWKMDMPSLKVTWEAGRRCRSVAMASPLSLSLTKIMPAAPAWATT